MNNILFSPKFVKPLHDAVVGKIIKVSCQCKEGVCRRCKGSGEDPNPALLKKRGYLTGECDSCQGSGNDDYTKRFWSEKISIRNRSDVARINGNHYIIGDGHRAVLGMGGEKHTIQFDDGRVVKTNDLWHQGTIPKEFREILPDNAKFI